MRKLVLNMAIILDGFSLFPSRPEPLKPKLVSSKKFSAGTLANTCVPA